MQDWGVGVLYPPSTITRVGKPNPYETIWKGRGVKAAPFSYCLNRGLARIRRMPRILGTFVYYQFSWGGWETLPEYKEKQRQRQKAWRTKNPDYDKNRYANDPEYAESRKTARRKKYAEDPEYREREKQRRREFAKDNPKFKEKRKLYMREYRKRKRAEQGSEE